MVGENGGVGGEERRGQSGVCSIGNIYISNFDARRTGRSDVQIERTSDVATVYQGEKPSNPRLGYIAFKGNSLSTSSRAHSKSLTASQSKFILEIRFLNIYISVSENKPFTKTCGL